MMLSMIGFHLIPPLLHSAFFLQGYSDQSLEHRGSDSILAATVICRLNVSLPSMFLDYLLIAKKTCSSQVGKKK